MYWLRKLKPVSILTPLAPALTVLLALYIFWVLWGAGAALSFFGVVFLLFGALSVISYIRTTHYGYIITALFQISAAFTFAGKPGTLFFISDRFTSVASALTLVFLIWAFYLWLTKRLKWRIRELMELAAQPVTDTTNGFTPRPRPMGQVEYSRFELIEFARFAFKNHMAIPYIEVDRVVLVPTDWNGALVRLLGLRRDYASATWVAFDYNGRVTVNIAQGDYLKYKESLSFDRLCQSLGCLFVEFLELFRKGEGIRIIDNMNAVREHPAS